jgi:hypothetical protein
MDLDLRKGDRVIRISESLYSGSTTARLAVVEKVTPAGYVHVGVDRFLTRAEWPLPRAGFYRKYLVADTPANRERFKIANAAEGK